MQAANKSTQNKFFNSTYADLAEVWEACRKPLTDNSLAIVQTIDPPIPITPTVYDAELLRRQEIAPEIQKPKEKSSSEIPLPAHICVITTLFHVSGEWIESRIHMPVMLTRASKDDPRLVYTPQSYGSAITYARRYLLAALVGVAQDDDDGSRASNNERGRTNAVDRVTDPRKEVIDSMAKMDEIETKEELKEFYDKFRSTHQDINDTEARVLKAKAINRSAEIQKKLAATEAEAKPTVESEDQRPTIAEEDVPQ